MRDKIVDISILSQMASKMFQNRKRYESMRDWAKAMNAQHLRLLKFQNRKRYESMRDQFKYTWSYFLLSSYLFQNRKRYESMRDHIEDKAPISSTVAGSFKTASGMKACATT